MNTHPPLIFSKKINHAIKSSNIFEACVVKIYLCLINVKSIPKLSAIILLIIIPMKLQTISYKYIKIEMRINKGCFLKLLYLIGRTYPPAPYLLIGVISISPLQCFIHRFPRCFVVFIAGHLSFQVNKHCLFTWKLISMRTTKMSNPTSLNLQLLGFLDFS